VVAERQLALPADYISAAVQSTDTSGGNADQAAGVNVVHDDADSSVVVTCARAALRFDSATATISLLQDSKAVVEALQPAFYRAPTDNDRGGPGGSAYASRWREAGLNRMAAAPGSCTFTVPDQKDSSSAQFTACWTMKPSGETLNHEEPAAEEGGNEIDDNVPTAEGVRPRGPDDVCEGTISVEATVTMESGGAVSMQWHIDATDALPAPLASEGLIKSLARVGLHFTLPVAPNGGVAWYGCGPHECYWDRQWGARLARHAVAAVDDLHVPYIVPGECGGRTGVRWLALPTGPSTSLLAAAVDEPLQMNVSRYNVETLGAAKHEHELTRSDLVHVFLDHRHMGIGGDDSWSPSVLPEYTVPPAKYSFGVQLKLAPTGSRDEAAVLAAAACHAANNNKT